MNKSLHYGFRRDLLKRLEFTLQRIDASQQLLHVHRWLLTCLVAPSPSFPLDSPPNENLVWFTAA